MASNQGLMGLFLKTRAMGDEYVFSFLLTSFSKYAKYDFMRERNQVCALFELGLPVLGEGLPIQAMLHATYPQ